MLLLTPLYILFLGVESYGLIGFYLSWIAILGILDTGISATAVREIAWYSARPHEKQRIPVLLKTLEVLYWGFILFLGIAILIGAWFFGSGWFQLNDLPPDVVRDALMLMAVSLVVQVPSGLYIGGLMGLQRQVECSVLLSFFGTFRGVGSIMVLWLIHPDIRIFFLWHIIVSVLQTGVMRWSLWRKVSVGTSPTKFSLEMLQSIKLFAGNMMLITVMGVLMSQTDKIVLSRLTSLEMFGFYMLAWNVSSGLSRLATPLIQAFGPHFTELVSKSDDERLEKQLRLASQLMSVLIIPPAILIMFLAKPLLLAWLGNEAASEGVAPILVILVVGVVFTSCSFPALSVLYSKKRFKPVLAVNLICLVTLLPLLIIFVINFGVIGAAFIWALYGLILYLAFQAYGLQGLPNTSFFSSIIRDFVFPCITAFSVAGIAGYSLNETQAGLTFVFLFILALLLSWIAALLSCTDLRKIVIGK
jgi:O-antigen/teichoic acid export membrane protein